MDAVAVAPDTSSVAEGDLDSSSEETSLFAGALSSASGEAKYTTSSKDHYLRLKYIHNFFYCHLFYSKEMYFKSQWK